MPSPPTPRRLCRTRGLWPVLVTVSSVALGASVLVSGAPQPAARPAARTVWDGVFTAAQAERGRGFYAEHCAECHGDELQGREYRALKGERFWVSFQETTVDYLLGQISANMPHSEDGSLKGTLGAAVYADIVAHILNGNAFPAGAQELSQATSAGVHIVKKEGPGELPSGSFGHVVGCLVRGADSKTWRLTRGSRPVRVLSEGQIDVKAPLGDREYALMFVLTPLDKFVGHRMSVRAALMGEGGADGLNVRSIDAVSQTCE